ncbi:hypothetical protein [Sphingomonas oryzagri]|uniref:Uncharacterized protein n=1 Tax=Sphingomonas oryzagri TaxID=3042314 RepID=A0ABT6MYX8_9SPHN|nr:hypothetical protein [Sphingomonas oryzagri]MDH7638265.1 hypothetical protein [Sphingomonas oryzagri]
MNRILVTDSRAPLRTNEASDPNDHLHLGVACPPSMRCGEAPMITAEQKIGFYREWSSRAARQALSAMQRQTKERCTHSAGMWSLIADALEAGDDVGVASLTHNLIFLKPNYLVPAI